MAGDIFHAVAVPLGAFRAPVPSGSGHWGMEAPGRVSRPRGRRGPRQPEVGGGLSPCDPANPLHCPGRKRRGLGQGGRAGALESKGRPADHPGEQGLTPVLAPQSGPRRWTTRPWRNSTKPSRPCPCTSGSPSTRRSWRVSTQAPPRPAPGAGSHPARDTPSHGDSQLPRPPGRMERGCRALRWAPLYPCQGPLPRASSPFLTPHYSPSPTEQCRV